MVDFEDPRNVEVRETILIYGASKVGKTWFYCAAMESIFAKNPKARFFVLNTDDGFKKTFEGYFKSRGLAPPYERVKTVYTPDTTTAALMVAKAKTLATKDDWLVMDLISDYYTMAKDTFFAESAKSLGITIDQYVRDVAKKKIGGLDASTWGLVSMMNNSVAYDPIARPYCNIIGVATEKSLEVAETFANFEKKQEARDQKKDYLSAFHRAGALPGGHKDLPYKFSTIVRLTGSKIDDKKFCIISDRGYSLDTNEERKIMGNPYDELLKAREELTFKAVA